MFTQGAVVLPKPDSDVSPDDDQLPPTLLEPPGFSSRSEASSELVAGVQVGRFQVQRRLGGGGFGTVYLARDTDMDRLVALKFPNSKLLATSRARDEFQREARCTAKLRHERIVTVFDFGQHTDGRWFIVYEYISGTNLAEVLKQRKLSPLQVSQILAQVADALHHAHQQGLVHRDIKPANILLDEQDRPYVADFGLAVLEEESLLVPNAAISGTPAYMSPEQIRGEGHRIDSRTDIYSLGVVLYQALCGRRPFDGRTTQELATQINDREPRPPRLIEPTVPRELERICLKAMSKRIGDRYLTAGDFAEELRGAVTDFSPLPEVTNASIAAERVVTAGSPTPIGPPTPLPTLHGIGADTDSETHSSGRQITPIDSNRSVVRVVPKGLRSFDASDADFFQQLLPGSRDRDGLPDSIRFWKSRIEQRDLDQTFSVGLIYGPSGCGKSSLVKAGLLPRVVSQSTTLYIEATPDDTELKLALRLERLFPGLRTAQTSHDESGSGPLANRVATGRPDVSRMIAQLRRDHSWAQGRKVLIVIDQFEQWLQTRGHGGSHAELVAALRQANGRDVQFLLMIRDDFWLAAARLFQDMEIPLIEGHNLRLVDLFDQRHARRVLQLYGQAYDRLPEDPATFMADQRAFLDQAVADLSDQEKVVSVRLSLFADMMKGHDWTPAALGRLGGTEGVGVAFLEETFSSRSASPEHRAFEKPIRAVLAALLPDAGTDIKGRMRSREELLKLSGLSSEPQFFQRVMGILDAELRIITPTESPLGELANAPAESNAASEHCESTAHDARYYQLTHDYLVGPLRLWLTQKDRQTFRGRARLALLEQAGRWHAFGRKNADLPGFLSLVAMLLGTTPANADSRAMEMLRAACLQKLVRRMCGTVFVIWPLLQIALVMLTLAGVYLTRHATAEGELVGSALVELAGPLSLAAIAALVTGVVFIRRVTLYGLWIPWRRGWAFGLRPVLLVLLLGTLTILPVIGFLKATSVLPAVGARAEQHIASQLELNQPDAALTHLDRAIDEFPTPEMYLHRARLHLAARKDYEPVIADCTQAIDGARNEPFTGRMAAAKTRWIQFTGFAPNVTEAHFLRAEAYRLMGQTDAATADLLRVLERNSKANDLFFGQAAVSLWRVSPWSFWKQPDRESLARGLGRTALQDHDPLVRRDAVYILGQLGHQAVSQVDSLRRSLKDVNLEVQIAAVSSLALIDWRPDEALPVLSKAITSPHEHIRKAATQVATQLGSAALPLVSVCIEEAKKNSGRDSDLQSISAAVGPRAVRVLIGAIATAEEPQDNLQQQVLSALRMMGTDAKAAVPTLEPLLSNPEFDTNSNWTTHMLLEVLGQAGDEGTAVLIRQLENPSEDARIQAAQQLGESLQGMSVSSTISELTTALASPSIKFRVAAANALWRLEQSESLLVPAFLAGLKYDDLNVRQQAAQGLAQFGPEGKAAIPALIEALNSPDWSIRSSAAQGLWNLERRAELVVPALVALFRDKQIKHPWERASIGSQLADIGIKTDSKQIIPVLMESLAESDTAVELLPQFREQVIGPLISALQQTENPRLRERAARSLTLIGPAAQVAVPNLRAVLQDKDAKVRTTAASALWAIARDATAGLQIWIEGLKSSELSERNSSVIALQTLGKQAQPAISALLMAARDTDSTIRVEAAFALWELQNSPEIVFEVLVKDLNDPQQSGMNSTKQMTLRKDFGESLSPMTPLLVKNQTETPTTFGGGDLSNDFSDVMASVGRSTIPALLHLLKHPKRDVRLMAVRALASLEEDARDAVPALHKLLEDEELVVRVAAARALWKIDRQVEKVIPLLVSCLDQDQTARDAILHLEDMGTIAKPAVDALTRRLDDPNRTMRVAAGKTLFKIGGPVDRVVPVMIREIQNRRSTSRTDAANILAEIGPAASDALPALRAVLQEDDLTVRLSVVPAIAKISQRMDDVLPVIVEGLKSPIASHRVEAANACGTIGSIAHVAVPTLIEHLADSDILVVSPQFLGVSFPQPLNESVRQSLVSALGTIGPRAGSATVSLRSLLADADPSVRVRAAWALCKIEQKPDSGVRILIQSLRDGERSVRENAAWSLNDLGPSVADAIPALKEALHDPSWSVRQNAKLALKKIKPVR